MIWYKSFFGSDADVNKFFGIQSHYSETVKDGHSDDGHGSDDHGNDHGQGRSWQ